MTQPNPLNPAPKPPTPEVLAGALQTLMQALTFQPSQQVEWQAMVEVATKVDMLDLQLKRLQEEKKTAADALIPLLHKLSGGKLKLGNGNEILACTSQDRRASKKLIVAHFGKEQGAAFWKTVPSKVREYISVRRPGETVAVEEGEPEDAPEPAPTAAT